MTKTTNLEINDSRSDKETGNMTKTCESGTVTGERCEERAEVVVEWMPFALRESHRAAGNWGRYPMNGAILLHVCEGCAIDIVDGDEDEYASVRQGDPWRSCRAFCLD